MNVSLMTKDDATLSVISVELIGSALLSIVEEMGKALVRAAYSFTVKERMDCSTALFDRYGNTIAQAEHIPMHLGSLIGAVRYVVDHFDSLNVCEGDVFICNDAYVSGGTHLNDIVLIEPIVLDGSVVAWVCNTAHHSDFINRGRNDIFQEGLRIPPIRLYSKGEINQDVMDLILLNCQLPSERIGDFRAQMACNRVGIKRFLALCEKYGAEAIFRASGELMDYAERMTRAGISEIADGEYVFEHAFDTTLHDEILDLRVRVVVSGGDIYFDLSENPDQVGISINAITTAVQATVYLALKTILNKDIPTNSGFHRPIHINAPAGSIFNAQAPAPVYNREDVLYRLVDMIYAALCPAIPDRVIAGCTAGVATMISGNDPRTGRFFAFNETVGGGFGARNQKDGLDAVQPHMTNSANIPIEALESEWPCMVERYELVQDSGGAGRWRGGMAIRRQVKILADDCKVRIGGSSARVPPWGLSGGEPGGLSRVDRTGTGPAFHRREANIQVGESVIIQTAGGGGFGSPKERDRSLVLKDLKEERISPQVAIDTYGLDPATVASVTAAAAD